MQKQLQTDGCAFHETERTNVQGQKARHAARELVDQQANSNHGQALEGFGVITLASMFPILAVEVMSIGISLRYSPEVILMLTLFQVVPRESCPQILGTDVVEPPRISVPTSGQ